MKNNHRILLVEDDHCIRNLMEEVLTYEGYHTTAVQNGMTAISHLLQHPFDLLITDFRMPQLSGVDLLNWCKRNNILVPVIFMSATSHLYLEEKLALDSLQATLLHKPFNLEYFLAVVEHTVDQRQIMHFIQMIIS